MGKSVLRRTNGGLWGTRGKNPTCALESRPAGRTGIGDGERNQKASLSQGTQYIKDKFYSPSACQFQSLPTLPPQKSAPSSFFFFQPHILWDHSFPTRDQTGPLAVKVQSLNHWTARETPPLLSNFFSTLFILMHLFFISFPSIYTEGRNGP